MIDIQSNLSINASACKSCRRSWVGVDEYCDDDGGDAGGGGGGGDFLINLAKSTADLKYRHRRFCC